jgi:ribonuclease HII
VLFKLESINEIKNIVESACIEDIPQIITKFEADERKGVIKLIESAKKRYDGFYFEQERLKNLCFYENQCHSAGYKFVAGIDEVGRGPFAGPVVTAAVILKEGDLIEGINDSKKLSAAKREQLFDEIINRALAYSFGVVSHEEIDELNILQATKKAMSIAVDGLKIKPDFVLIDALTIPDINIKQKGIIKGDAKSISIGAASIIAKVYRDRMMTEYDKIYPGYDFAENKGYGTKAHIDAIIKNGICPIHRKSFVKKYAGALNV